MIEEQANSLTPMEREDDWIIDVLDGLKETTPISPDWSIGKVRRNLRSVNEDAYTPHIVSIGPIHYGDESLLPMEDHKRRYLLSLFKRTEEPEQILEKCCHAIKTLGEKVRALYAEPIPYDESRLAKILLHDAGFLLELFFRYYQKDRRILQNDPIFTTSWMVLELQRDLSLLENQIPFFVLKSLSELIVPHIAAAGLPPLKELALEFFKYKFIIRKKEIRKEGWEEGNHLLHLLYNCYLPPGPYPADSEDDWEIIHCATSLHQAGVKFQKNSRENMFDFQFDKATGIFKIPELLIEDYTDSLFRNLVAFEQSLPSGEHYIISYIMLMDKLIDTTNDVHLLQRKRIIQNHLGSEGDVSNLFNDIGKEIVFGKFYFAGLCNQVDEYAKSPWHRYKVALRRDYFKNPWSITSFVAAVTLLVLTFLQTLYSLLSYYQKSNSILCSSN